MTDLIKNAEALLNAVRTARKEAGLKASDPVHPHPLQRAEKAAYEALRQLRFAYPEE